jgi:hypothetical protein
VKRAHKDVFGKPVPYSRPIRYDITVMDPASRLAMFSLERFLDPLASQNRSSLAAYTDKSVRRTLTGQVVLLARHIRRSLQSRCPWCNMMHKDPYFALSA